MCDGLVDGGVGLRIGELAAVAGVSTRVVRHYHRIGLLPEPERDPNGYRSYQMRDVVGLLRVRRLFELGLSLDEVGAALSGSDGGDLSEILADIDADLGAQQERIAARRDRIAAVLANPDGLDSAQKDALMTQLGHIFGADQVGLRREQVVADLLEATVDPATLAQVWETYRQLLAADPAAVRSMADVTERFDHLAGLDPHDPAVGALADVAVAMSEVVQAVLPVEVRESAGDPVAADRLLQAMTAAMGPAQARCLRLMFDGWRKAAS